MIGLRCRVASWWPEGIWPLGLRDRHREHCLRCQAEQVRGRALERVLVSMSDETVAAPAFLHAATVARLGTQDAADPRRQLVARVAARYAAAAGVTAATAVALLSGLARRRSRAVG
jgi:hypothetical protein